MIWSREMATPAFWQRYSTSLNSSGPSPTASPATRTSRAARSTSTSPKRRPFAVAAGAAGPGSRPPDQWDRGVGFADMRLEPRDQFGAAKRLRDEVVGAGVESSGDGGLVGPARQEHDRHQGILGAQLATDVDPRTVGEA